jgi:hypothetical protein
VSTGWVSVIDCASHRAHIRSLLIVCPRQLTADSWHYAHVCVCTTWKRRSAHHCSWIGSAVNFYCKANINEVARHTNACISRHECNDKCAYFRMCSTHRWWWHRRVLCVMLPSMRIEHLGTSHRLLHNNISITAAMIVCDMYKSTCAFIYDSWWANVVDCASCRAISVHCRYPLHYTAIVQWTLWVLFTMCTGSHRLWPSLHVKLKGGYNAHDQRFASLMNIANSSSVTHTHQPCKLNMREVATQAPCKDVHSSILLYVTDIYHNCIPSWVTQIASVLATNTVCTTGHTGVQSLTSAASYRCVALRYFSE